MRSHNVRTLNAACPYINYRPEGGSLEPKHTANCVLMTIQGVSRLSGITTGGDFLGLCDEKSSYKCVRFWTVTEL